MITFFGSDQYSEIVRSAIINDGRFELGEKGNLGIVASYGKIISNEEILGFEYGILNLHPSLLPKYRGASPVQTAILNNEKETGITIIKIDEKVDHGPILAQVKEIILPTDTSETLYNRLFKIGADLLLQLLPDYLAGRAKLFPQDHTKATFTKRLTRDDGKIDWEKPADHNERFIRAMHPWPGAWTEIEMQSTKAPKHQSSESLPLCCSEAKRIKILKAHLENSKLVLDMVQLEGKNPVTWKQFCEGYPELVISFRS